MEENENIETIALHPIQEHLNYTVYEGSYKGSHFKLRKSKIDGSVKFLITSELLNSGLIKFNVSRIAFPFNEFEGKWMELEAWDGNKISKFQL